MLKGVLKKLAKLTGTHSFQRACNLIKNETLEQVFSCELCEIFKNVYFIEQHRTTENRG